MSGASDLIERHRRVLDRREFQWDAPEARLGIDIETTSGATESWLAAVEDGRLALRRVEPGSGAPHAVLTVPSADLALHLLGEVDMFTAPQRTFRFQLAPAIGPDLASTRLISLIVRLLAVLGVSCHGRDAFRGTVMEELYLSYRSPRKDGSFEPMGDWSLPLYAGQQLYDLVRAERPDRTLEIGLAHGLSALFIAAAHRDNGRGRHLAIDPCQSSLFGGCGVMNLERAGLDRRVEVIEEPDYTVLPRLLGQRFQLVFVDGLHHFDYVLLDFFYGDLLLDVGGHLVFDDASEAGVKDALDFILANRFDGYQRVDESSSPRVAVLEKIGEDNRLRKYGALFHRPFAGSAAPPSPLPPVASSRALKHAVDRTIAFFAAMVLAPIALLVAAAILVEDLCVGRGLRLPLRRVRSVSAGRPFEILTFRCAAGARSGGASRIGSLVEKLRLAKLPQLWNVLRGNMSLVGLTPIAEGDVNRRALFRDCGIRAGIVGPFALDGPRAGDLAYYDQCKKRSPLSLLAFDAAVATKVVARAVGRRRAV